MATNNKDFVIKNGGVVRGGKFTLVTPTTSYASLNLAHGTAPSSPVNGDMWTTTVGLYARINGSTVGPFGSGGGATVSGSAPGSPSTGALWFDSTGGGFYVYNGTWVGVSGAATGGTTFDSITSTTGAATAATLWNDITTGSITVGGGLTSGGIDLGKYNMSGKIRALGDIHVGGATNQYLRLVAGASDHAIHVGRTDAVGSTPGLYFHSSGGTGNDVSIRSLYGGGAGDGDLYIDAHGVYHRYDAGAPQYLVQNSSAGTSYWVQFIFRRMGSGDTATPNNATIGSLIFQSADSGNTIRDTATIWANIGTNASGGPPSSLHFSTSASGGTAADALVLDSNKSATFSGTIIAATGTSSIAPFRLTAGTNTSSLTDGNLEYDGDRLTFTKSTNAGRSLILSRQKLLASGNSSAATTTTPVSPFGTSNDTLTLEANKIYRFKGRYFFTPTFTSGTPNIQIGFTFSQTVQSIKYRFLSQVQAPARVVLASTRQGIVTSVSATQVTDTIASSVNWYCDFEGYVTTNASTGGTILPFFQMSTTGVSTVCSQYSSFEIELLGPAATVVLAGAWA